MWYEIKDEKDINEFMNTIYCFHDGCIKELKYISGSYVSSDLSMYPINDKRVIKMIIQRQFENPSVIEMEFVGVKRLILTPVDDDFTSEIHDATMLLKDDCIYWCDSSDVMEDGLDSYKGTLICASKARWRSADEYIGKNEVYTSSH